MKTFYGIADAHGIESFIPAEVAEKGPCLFSLQLRAEANRQRHTAVYKIDLEDEGVAKVEAQIKKGDFKSALFALKAHAKETAILRGMESSWGMIPDDKLDPYWREGDCEVTPEGQLKKLS